MDDEKTRGKVLLQKPKQPHSHTHTELPRCMHESESSQDAERKQPKKTQKNKNPQTQHHVISQVIKSDLIDELR